MECSWAELLKQMKTAEDLDGVITAHKQFLDVIVTRCLLDPHSQVKKFLDFLCVYFSLFLFFSKPLLTQLRTLFDRVVDYQNKQQNMFIAFIAESERRKQYELVKQSNIDEVRLNYLTTTMQ